MIVLLEVEKNEHAIKRCSIGLKVFLFMNIDQFFSRENTYKFFLTTKFTVLDIDKLAYLKSGIVGKPIQLNESYTILQIFRSFLVICSDVIRDGRARASKTILSLIVTIEMLVLLLLYIHWSRKEDHSHLQDVI